MSRQQRTLMKFDPVDGNEKPYPSRAEDYRTYHGDVAWLYCPWTGKHRCPRDIGSDVLGHLILPPGEAIATAQSLPIAELDDLNTESSLTIEQQTFFDRGREYERGLASKDTSKDLVAAQDKDDVQAKYNELLFAVAQKFPDETTHQTALRYIKTAQFNTASAANIEGLDYEPILVIFRCL